MGEEEDFDIDLGEEIFDEDYDNILESPKKNTPQKQSKTTKKAEENKKTQDENEDEDEDEDLDDVDEALEEATESHKVRKGQGIEPLPPMRDNADIASEHRESESEQGEKFGAKEQQFKKGEGFEYIASPDKEEDTGMPFSDEDEDEDEEEPQKIMKKSRSSSRTSSLGSNAEETILKLTETNQKLREQLVKLSRTLDYHLQQKGIKMRKKSAPKSQGSDLALLKQLKAYRKANAELKQKLYTSDNVEKVASLKNKIREQNHKIKELHSEIRSLNNITREQSKQLEVLDNGNEDIIAKNENAIRVQKAEARKYRTENKKLHDQITKMRRQIRRVTNENDKYKDLLSKHDMSVDAAEEIEALRKQLEDAKQAKEEADRKVSITQKAIDSLKRRQLMESKRYRTDKKQLKAEIGDLESKIAHHRYTPGSTAATATSGTKSAAAPASFESRIPKPSARSSAKRRPSRSEAKRRVSKKPSIPKQRKSISKSPVSRKASAKRSAPKSRSPSSKSPATKSPKSSKSPQKRSTEAFTSTDVKVDVEEETFQVDGDFDFEGDDLGDLDIDGLLNDADTKSKALDAADAEEATAQNDDDNDEPNEQNDEDIEDNVDEENVEEDIEETVNTKEPAVKETPKEAAKPEAVEPTVDQKSGDDDFDPYKPF